MGFRLNKGCRIGPLVCRREIGDQLVAEDLLLQGSGAWVKKVLSYSASPCDLEWREPVALWVMNKEQWEKVGQPGKKVGAAPLLFSQPLASQENPFSHWATVLYFSKAVSL